jgi:serine protease Do
MRIAGPGRLLAIAAAALLAAACTPAASPTPSAATTPSAAPSVASAEPSPSAAFELGDVQQSVAFVETQGTFVSPEGAEETGYTGTAFVVDDGGYLVPNNHVVTGGAFWKITLNEETYDARVIGSSECHDLAVLKITGDDLKALRWSEQEPRVGESIFVAGHPNGDTYTLTDGIVAKTGEASESSWTSIKEELQITAQTFPGNSGSPVVSEEGAVLGVHYAGGTQGSQIEGQSFAISAVEAKPVVEQLMEGENVEYVGINGEAIEEAGIWVVSVAPGSPASKTGILAGDLLTNVSGSSVGLDGTKSNYCSGSMNRVTANIP